MRIILISAVIAVLAPVWGLAEASDVMTLVRRNYSGAGAVTATFDLNIYWNVRERDEKKSGELLIAPGDRFRVTLGREVFVSDGKTFWQYSERNSQVIVRNFADIDPSTLPSKMLSSFLSTRRFTEKRRGGGTVELEWKGGAGEQFNDGYTAITAVIEEKTGVINVLELTDANDNVHTYAFKKTTFDKPPRSDAFQFKAPRGVEVMDMRDGNAPN